MNNRLSNLRRALGQASIEDLELIFQESIDELKRRHQRTAMMQVNEVFKNE